MNDFSIGFFTATLTWFIIIGGMCWLHKAREESGYTDKMVISYHCPGKEYERQRFKEVVYGTGIQTNFVNLETNMDKNWIRIRMTNPKMDN